MKAATTLWLLSGTVQAQLLVQQGAAQGDSPPIPTAVQKRILERLQTSHPTLRFSHVRPSPIPGLYQVNISNQLNTGNQANVESRVAFVSDSGDYLIAGEMYAVRADGLVNLQERERREAEKAFEPDRAKLVAAVDKSDMVIFTPEGKTKGHIYIFTDIDCGFCRKLHSQMDAMLAKGIEVRYLAFPRAGPKSRSADKLITTWCAKSPQEVMTRFKGGENVSLALCDNNPIAEQYKLGQQVGVRGTPAIVLASGQLIPGAVSPEFLAQEMGI